MITGARPPRLVFVTEYTQGPNRYSTYLLARDKADAQRLVNLRNLGEVLEDCEPATIFERGGRVTVMTSLTKQLRRLRKGNFGTDERGMNLLHSACHVAHIAQASGRWMPPSNVFSDLGMFHQLAHCADPTIRDLVVFSGEETRLLHADLDELERAAPEMFWTDAELLAAKEAE